MRDSTVLLGGMAVLALLQLAFRALMVGTISVEAYGRAALLLSIFAVTSSFGSFGLPSAAARLAASGNGYRRDRLVLRRLALASIGPITAASAAMALGSWLVSRSWLVTLLALVGVPPFVVATYYMGFMRGKGRVWSAALVMPASMILQLAFLAVASIAEPHVDTADVMAAYYAGNLTAYAVALAILRRFLRTHGHDREEVLPGDLSPRSIFKYSTWLSVSQVTILLLALLPRIVLARVNYVELAYLDIALLLYSLPQRLRASFVLALIPHAVRHRGAEEQILVPGPRDVGLFTLGVLAVDGVLWQTHFVKFLFTAFGMRHYTGAEPLLLILLLAAPAEIFFGINSAVLEALGRTKAIAVITMSVVALFGAAGYLGQSFGPDYLAALLVASYWLLYFLTRRSFAAGSVREARVAPIVLKRLTTSFLART